MARNIEAFDSQSLIGLSANLLMVWTMLGVSVLGLRCLALLSAGRRVPVTALVAAGLVHRCGLGLPLLRPGRDAFGCSTVCPPRNEHRAESPSSCCSGR